MKCPKCGYIGFEQTERCRNCGYDFSLSSPAPSAPDLPLRPGEIMGPLADLELTGVDQAVAASPTPASVRRRPAGRVAGETITPPEMTPPPDLPLFDAGAPAVDDRPLIAPAAPSVPLAVRRSTPPARTRPRPTPRVVEPQPNLDLLPDSVESVSAAPAPDEVDGSVASIGRRLSAAIVDGLILGGLDLVVIYFTLRMCRLAAADIRLLPVAPLAAFFLLLNGGYLALLTAAGGQTIGKMATGVKVIGANEGRLSFGQAVLRALALVAGTAALGVGLLPALFDRDRRGLHDRLAATRVVRVTVS